MRRDFAGENRRENKWSEDTKDKPRQDRSAFLNAADLDNTAFEEYYKGQVISSSNLSCPNCCLKQLKDLQASVVSAQHRAADIACTKQSRHSPCPQLPAAVLCCAVLWCWCVGDRA
jgi:hypothetical protein